ncbi:MAG: ATP-dependent 6-phosphofructokinase, partial [Verrucomicrobia bacterium]
GYAGLVKENGLEPLPLDSEAVDHIEDLGGTILGTSRGPQDTGRMVDYLEELGINLLFVIGGDGTLRGGRDLAAEIRRRSRAIAVVGVPKTIDNDIEFIEMSFGFRTAVAEAGTAVAAAHVEAKSARYGVGLVKLMGRHSGFIAAHATLAGSLVNFCLVPESPFTLEAFLPALERRLRERGHAVVVVAEGAGQDLIGADLGVDASGNRRLADIGVFLRDRIRAYMAERNLPVSLKYIDPSYMIRGIPANAFDSAFCLLLGHNAVHAAMSGRTNMVVGYWHGEFTHVPIPMAVSRRKQIDLDSRLWSSVLAATGQPRDMR